MAKPIGKVQRAIMAYLSRGAGCSTLPDMAADRSFYRFHYAQIERSAEALERKGLLRFRRQDGDRLVCPRKQR